jgi:trehalose 6-phosphate phosphatase
MPNTRPQPDSRKMLMTMTMPVAMPDLRATAFLLDVDGTLIDIAPTPGEVVVPSGLRRTLARLAELTDGAVALVSGRSVSDLDRLFEPLRLNVVGGHGAEFRLLDVAGAPHVTPSLGPELRERLVGLAGAGVLAEDKGYAVALHYRLVPAKEEAVRDAVARICGESWPVPIEVLPGKSVIEIKVAGFNKGTAVRELMRRPPFAGRIPIFIGDDTTDEAVFAVMPDFDGLAFSVGRQVAGAINHFDTPADVRAWLAQIVAAAESGA